MSDSTAASTPPPPGPTPAGTDPAEERASTDGWIGLILGVVALLAACYAGWLTYIKLESLYSCNPTVFNSCGGEGSACEKVMMSAWSMLLGKPITVFATALYADRKSTRLNSSH